MRIFIAGPLFSEAEREFNMKIDRRLREQGFETFLPQRDVGKLWDRAKKWESQKYRRTYEEDLKGLEWSDVVIAVLDGTDVDSGTAFEIGYATARGKPVVGIKTDKRMFAEGEELNNMLTQSIRAVARSIEELAAELESIGK